MAAYSASHDEVFASYVARLRLIPLLDPEEERSLARHYRDGRDTRAAHRLIESNLRFVVKIALEFKGYRVRLSDLVQEGNLGLMRAVQKYDPEKCNRLVSYAVHWIRAYIRAHVMRSWSLVAMGRTRAERRLFFSLARAQAELARLSPEAWKEMGGDEVQAIAARFGLQVEEVIEMQARLGGRDTSLDAPLGDDGDRTFGDLLAGDDVPADDALRGEELRVALENEVETALLRLDTRERDIVRRRLLVDGPGETMAVIAGEYGVSRERVRQLELRGLEKLRAHLRGIAIALDYPGALDAKPLYVRALVKGSRRDARAVASRRG